MSSSSCPEPVAPERVGRSPDARDCGVSGIMDAMTRRRKALPVLCMSALLLVVTALPAHATPGDLDTDFGLGGAGQWGEPGLNVQTPITGRGNGKFALGFSKNPDEIGVAGFRANGENDDDFGTDSLATVAIPDATSVSTNDITTDRKGRFVLANTAGIAVNNPFVVTRFRANGAPDSSFSRDGVAKIRFKGTNAEAYGVATRGNTIIVVGAIFDGTEYKAAVAMLNENGSLRQSFGKGGRKLFSAPGSDIDGTWRVIPGPKGTWLLTGWADRPESYHTLVIKLLANGKPDPTFAGNGIATYDFSTGVDDDNYAYGIAKDGKKLVLAIAGMQSVPRVARLTKNGGRDGTFGANGVAAFGYDDFVPNAIIVDDQHRLIVSGGGLGGLRAIRVQSTGQPDLTWGTDDIAENGQEAVAFDLMFQGSKVLVSGGEAGTIQVSRYLTS